MKSIQEQLQEAEHALKEQRMDYEKGGIPIALSPKLLTFHLRGAGTRLRDAVNVIKAETLRITAHPEIFCPIFYGKNQDIKYIMPWLHFDFEEREVRSIKLAAQIIADRNNVKVSGFAVNDMFVDEDTVHPFDIPTNWTACTVHEIPITGIGKSPITDSTRTGFSVASYGKETSMRNLRNVSIDPRLTRVKLYTLLRDIIEGTKPHRTELVDIEFTAEEEA